ncbi:beta-lactamase/transpeptidase-like protein [Chytriomyces sp. MP71]|nr:beta-lactamase/transpeptidase-like protein [Chytriomyces sp. MP71]
MMAQPITVLLVLYAAYLYFIRSGPVPTIETKLFGLNAPSPVIVKGFTAPGFERLKPLMEQGFRDGVDLGSQFAVYVDGQLVVDLYGGHTSRARTNEYNADTLQQVFSSSKCVTSMVFSHLLNTGRLHLADPVAHYWPQFGQGGKQNVTVRDLLRHRAGVAWLDKVRVPRPEHLLDLDALAQRISNQGHNFGGKRVSAYHAVTRGWFLNELARRVTGGKTVRDIMYEEILPMINGEMHPDAHAMHYAPRESSTQSSPFQFHYGIPDEPTALSEAVRKRMTQLDGPSLVQMMFQILVPRPLLRALGIYPIPFALIKAYLLPGSIPNKALLSSGPDFTGRNGDFPFMYNDPTLRRTQSPSFNGLTNARSLARLVEHFRRSQLNTKNSTRVGLVGSKLFEQLMHVESAEWDVVIENPLAFTENGMGRFDHGFGAYADETRVAMDTTFYGWIGAGGSLALFERHLGISMSFTMCFTLLQSVGDERSWRLIEEVVRVAKALKKAKAATATGGESVPSAQDASANQVARTVSFSSHGHEL